MSAEVDVPNWISLLIASGGGFVVGITLTVAWKARVAISIGKRYISVPHWSVIAAAIGAALSVITAVSGALAVPTVTHMVVAAGTVILFGIAGIGAVKSD